MSIKGTLTIGCWLMVIGSWAQTTLNDTLREVTVTQDRHSHALKSTAPMHVIDRRDLLTMGIADMADALHRLPGITLRDYGGAGGMKTVSVRGFGAKHTGVSYDGVLLSECQGGEIDLSRYSLDNVAHLTLLIGDNSDIFIPVRNATAPATLNIQTTATVPGGLNNQATATVPDGLNNQGTATVPGGSPPGSKPRLTAQLRAGSFGYTSPFLRYEQLFSPSLAIAATAEYVYAENDYPYTIKNGITTVHDHRRNSRMNSGHAEVDFRFCRGYGGAGAREYEGAGAQSYELRGKLYYYDNDRQLPGQVRYYTNLSRETLRDRNAFGQFVFQTHWQDQLALKWIGKYNWAASSYRDPLYTGGVMDADYWQREAYTSAALLYTPTEQWAFDYSADYALNNLNSSLSTDTRPYRHTILQSATARMTNGRMTVMTRMLYSLILNGARGYESAGARGYGSAGASSYEEARDMRRLSPSLSLSYKPLANRQLFVRASFKNIFRAPTFNENYFFHYGSPNLKPESTNQLNLGVTYVATPSPHTDLTVTADGYYNEVTDKIVAVPYNMFVWRCVNVGKVKTLGVDATLRLTHRFSANQRLTAHGTYSYQQSENRSLPGSNAYGLQLAYTPKHTGSAAVAYENPWLSVSLHGQGVSRRWANNEHYPSTDIPAYWETGLTLWRTFTLRHCRLEGRLDVRNLTNQQYEIVRFYPMPGRSWQLSLNFEL